MYTFVGLMEIESKFKISFSKVKPAVHAVKLSAAAELKVRKCHPWVFSEGIIKIKPSAKTGDLAVIFSQKDNKLIGIGLFDAISPIRIKLIYHGRESKQINPQFFSQKVDLAYQKRKPLLETATNSYRLIFGENDDFPSLIADVYDSVLVIKLYSEIWLAFFKSITESLIQVSNAQTVVVRLSRNLQNACTYPFKDGDIIYGELENETVEFVEHGIYFSANVIKGHKTGYFLDHRENRRKVGQMSSGKTVLDVFSYAGGFSVHALANNAKEVTSIDISEHALEIARQNGKRNAYSGKHLTIAGDAFKILNRLIDEDKTYDIVVIDPPSFAKRGSEIELAKKKYAQLARLGEKLTAKNGTLILASCSSRILAEVFWEINVKALNINKRKFEIIEKTRHDIDHPIGFQEGAYLKCGYYRLY
ncbi:MAG: class I SAM-dependent rRNA methyltransferase [Bacteroidota bacterium]